MTMTDLPPKPDDFSLGDGASDEGVAATLAPTVTVKLCRTCSTPLPVKGEDGYHVQRLYCEKCGPPTKPRKKKIVPTGDMPQSVINNNFEVKVPSPAKSKLDDRQQAVEQGFIDMMGIVPMGMAAFGDEVCPPAIKAALPAIGHQIAILSKYHPVLAKIFADGEISGELMAWFGLLLATTPVLIAVLAHHDMVPETIAKRVAYTAAMGPAIMESVVATLEVTDADDTAP